MSDSGRTMRPMAEWPEGDPADAVKKMLDEGVSRIEFEIQRRRTVPVYCACAIYGPKQRIICGHGDTPSAALARLAEKYEETIADAPQTTR